MTRNRRPATSRPIAVDLFSGAGGMSLGFEQAGFDIVYASDRDGYHVATHERNFPYGVSECASITDLTGEHIREVAKISGEVDLLFGGPPCQGFSHMGLRDVNDPRNSLVGEYVRLVEELRPRAFVMENVTGMAAGATRPILDNALARLEAAGYRVVHPVRVLNAANFGVPQARKRLFVIGIREDVTGKLTYPEGPVPGQPSRPTIREALQDLPSIEKLPESFDTDVAPYDKSPTSAYARALRGVEPDPTDLSRPRTWDKSMCTCVTKVRHGAEARALYQATRPGTMVPGHKLPRLDPDGVAPTLRAGSDSERGSHTAPRPVHYDEPRCITAREAARLHGYPDWFVFYPGKWHAYRQIGNSVCPPVARAVGYQIMKALGASRQAEPGPSVGLPSTFDLPEERPKTHRRLVHAIEFAKVVNLLFDEKYDFSKSRLKSETGFSQADVERAITESGANMPRVRAERFVEDISRSRNLTEILKRPLELGFTVARSNGGSLGSFVPVGTDGALGESDSIRVRSADLSSPRDLATQATELGGDVCHGALSVLEATGAFDEALGSTSGSGKLRLPRTLFGELELGRRHRLSAKGKKPALLVLNEDATLPLKSRLCRMVADADVDRCVVVAPLTRTHLLVIGLSLQPDGRMVEVNRAIYAGLLPKAEPKSIESPGLLESKPRRRAQRKV